MDKENNSSTIPFSSSKNRDTRPVLDISWETIFKIAVTFFCFYVLYLTKDILIWIVFALIISILFSPAINFLQKLRIHRTLAVVFVYIGVFGFFSLFLYSIIPSFGSEIQAFFNKFPQYFEQAAPFLEGLGFEAFEDMETLKEAVTAWATKDILEIFKTVAAIFGGIFSVVSIFAIAIFLSFEEKGVEKALLLLAPKKYEAYFLSLWEESQKKVAGWFGTRILSCIFVGIMAFIACYVLNIEYAVSFGILAGILDIIPIIGPLIAGAIIMIFAALDSWLKALLILVIFVLIQLIEGNILTPFLTKKFIGLPPVLVLIAVMLGAKLGGILGAVLAIPLMGIFFEFSKGFLRKRKESKAIVL